MQVSIDNNYLRLLVLEEVVTDSNTLHQVPTYFE